jgi:hypothetical protein
MGEMRNMGRILVGKTDGRRSLGRPSHRWENNIRMDLTNWVGKYGLNSSGLEQGLLTGSCEHSNEPLVFIKCEEFLTS